MAATAPAAPLAGGNNFFLNLFGFTSSTSTTSSTTATAPTARPDSLSPTNNLPLPVPVPGVPKRHRTAAATPSNPRPPTIASTAAPAATAHLTASATFATTRALALARPPQAPRPAPQRNSVADHADPSTPDFRRWSEPYPDNDENVRPTPTWDVESGLEDADVMADGVVVARSEPVAVPGAWAGAGRWTPAPRPESSDSDDDEADAVRIPPRTVSLADPVFHPHIAAQDLRRLLAACASGDLAAVRVALSPRSRAAAIVNASLLWATCATELDWSPEWSLMPVPKPHTVVESSVSQSPVVSSTESERPRPATRWRSAVAGLVGRSAARWAPTTTSPRAASAPAASALSASFRIAASGLGPRPSLKSPPAPGIVSGATVVGPPVEPEDDDAEDAAALERLREDLRITPLAAACLAGRVDVASALLEEFGADPAACDSVALFAAAVGRCVPCIRLLLAAGALIDAAAGAPCNPNAANTGLSLNPVVWAARANDLDTLDALLAHRPTATPPDLNDDDDDDQRTFVVSPGAAPASLPPLAAIEPAVWVPALHAAARAGHIEACRRVVRAVRAAAFERAVAAARGAWDEDPAAVAWRKRLMEVAADEPPALGAGKRRSTGCGGGGGGTGASRAALSRSSSLGGAHHLSRAASFDGAAARAAAAGYAIVASASVPSSPCEAAASGGKAYATSWYSAGRPASVGSHQAASAAARAAKEAAEAEAAGWAVLMDARVDVSGSPSGGASAPAPLMVGSPCAQPAALEAWAVAASPSPRPASPFGLRAGTPSFPAGTSASPPTWTVATRSTCGSYEASHAATPPSSVASTGAWHHPPHRHPSPATVPATPAPHPVRQLSVHTALRAAVVRRRWDAVRFFVDEVYGPAIHDGGVALDAFGFAAFEEAKAACPGVGAAAWVRREPGFARGDVVEQPARRAARHPAPGAVLAMSTVVVQGGFPASAIGRRSLLGSSLRAGAKAEPLSPVGMAASPIVDAVAAATEAVRALNGFASAEQAEGKRGPASAGGSSDGEDEGSMVWRF
ncbi:hypothetical protein HDU96_004224 [Phlyctochytrium bullatum]|nr:hypothetical protein HDU96_004224 [Phlyctochytrium bullatum]